MSRYTETLAIREAREQYFAHNGFDENSYFEKWVRLQAGSIPLYFPNTAARVRAVRFHDLHHVVTEYETTWTGEAEIGAWEIASGCADHYAAWQLNLQAMAIGLVIAPQEVYRAFMRGRCSKNLYREEFGDHLLSPTVGNLRQQLHLLAPSRPPTFRDILAFVGWASISILTMLLSLAIVLTPIVGVGWVLFR